MPISQMDDGLSIELLQGIREELRSGYNNPLMTVSAQSGNLVDPPRWRVCRIPQGPNDAEDWGS
jgi:hypothetical protein